MSNDPGVVPPTSGHIRSDEELQVELLELNPWLEESLARHFLTWLVQHLQKRIIDTDARSSDEFRKQLHLTLRAFRLAGERELFDDARIALPQKNIGLQIKWALSTYMSARGRDLEAARKAGKIPKRRPRRAKTIASANASAV